MCQKYWPIFEYILFDIRRVVIRFRKADVSLLVEKTALQGRLTIAWFTVFFYFSTIILRYWSFEKKRIECYLVKKPDFQGEKMPIVHEWLSWVTTRVFLGFGIETPLLQHNQYRWKARVITCLHQRKTIIW